MATNYKVLGQAALTAETNTDVYTVPADTQAVISTLTVCNRGAVANSFRIAIRPAGATIANEHYVAYDTAIAANDSTNLTLGITLAATDVVTVYGGATSTFSVSVFGSEIS
jgi:hypothetical protein